MPLLADTISVHLFPFSHLLKAQENRNEHLTFRREKELRHLRAKLNLRQANLSEGLRLTWRETPPTPSSPQSHRKKGLVSALAWYKGFSWGPRNTRKKKSWLFWEHIHFRCQSRQPKTSYPLFPRHCDKS